MLQERAVVEILILGGCIHVTHSSSRYTCLLFPNTRSCLKVRKNWKFFVTSTILSVSSTFDFRQFLTVFGSFFLWRFLFMCGGPSLFSVFFFNFGFLRYLCVKICSILTYRQVQEYFWFSFGFCCLLEKIWVYALTRVHMLISTKAREHTYTRARAHESTRARTCTHKHLHMYSRVQIHKYKCTCYYTIRYTFLSLVFKV